MTCTVDADAQKWLSVQEISDQGVLTLYAPENRGEERSGILHFVSAAHPEANIDITIRQADGSVIMQEDFSWLNGDGWNLTTDKRYDTGWTDEQRAKGWTISDAANPWLYARSGLLKLGKTNWAGDAISPKLEMDGQTADVRVTFKAITYESAKGVKDNNELYIYVLGGGTLEMENLMLIDPMQPMALSSPFNVTAYTPSCMKTVRMISRLSSMLLWAGHPAMEPTLSSFA